MGLLTDFVFGAKRAGRAPVEGLMALGRSLTSRRLTRRARRDYRVLWRDPRGLESPVCYFASFDRDNRVDPHVLHALSQWKSAGFAIVFVTTSARIDTADLVRLQASCSGVIQRVNLGYDFFSWKVGMEAFPAGDNGLVVWTNDSVYGPLEALEPWFGRAEALGADLVGMTDSWAPAWHLQSYFLVFFPGALDFLRTFVEGIVVEPDKSRLVRRFEVGLSQLALRAGLRLAALAEFRPLDARSQKQWLPGGADPRNPRHQDPTMVYAVPLVAERLSPFLKVSWVRDDPLGQHRAGLLEELWERAATVYPLGLVLDHLKRIGIGLTP